MTAILDCFRVALQNSGNDRVKFTTGIQLKRRKSRIYALDVPSGMQRNLSESHLVQAGSKAVSNVAEQFSKFAKVASLNPKILTGKKTNTTNSNETEAIFEAPTPILLRISCDEDRLRGSKPSIGQSVGITEPTNKYNDNSFLQSVGIVMVDAAELAETQNQSEPRKSSTSKNLENVTRISISSVMDNVKLPPEMLEINDARKKSSTPEISVHESEDRGEKSSNLKMFHSVSDMRSADSTGDGTR